MDYKELTKQEIIDRYGMSPRMIEDYLPEPRVKKNFKYKGAPPLLLWREEDVVTAIEELPELRREIRRREIQLRKRARREQDAMKFLQQFSPDSLFEDGKALDRHFILHIGPTNSGKTYAALQRLKDVPHQGVYLGPLRLLALEVSDTMNGSGHPCTLLTGEEFIRVEGAKLTASTIELADYSARYDVAVIDEAQLLADESRGPNWMAALCLIDAAEVNVCLAPEAEPILVSIMNKLEATYEIVRHDRLVPLEYVGEFEDISKVQPGDALITFSRRQVLQIAAALERIHISASVIYGALPPASRREEVRRFAEKETSVVVATDAIGMGISLPIKRVIFVETEKFDGHSRRKLSQGEIKQIAGRAGRYGKYDKGEVLTMADPELVEQAILDPVKPIHKLTLSFPPEALEYDRPLSDMLGCWDNLPKNDLFIREDMKESEFLLTRLDRMPPRTSKALVYSLITCPVDIKNDALVKYWKECSLHIVRGEDLVRPDYMEEESLEDCELKYRAFDVYHQLLRRIGVEEDCMDEKMALSYKINHFLKQGKSGFLKRCKRCGKELSLDSRSNYCDRCYYKYARH